MPDDSLSAKEIWDQTVPIIKDRVNHRSLWETLEKTVALAIEDDTFIVGLNARVFNHAGHLNVSEHRNAIETTISRLAGRSLKMRVIEGDTPEDWKITKTRDARVAVMREATYDQRDKQEAESQSWDSLMDYIAKTYSNTHMRSLPQNKARFLNAMLRVVADAMENLYPAKPDETTERHLARVIEKVANSADVASTVVAFELEKVREGRKTG